MADMVDSGQQYDLKCFGRANPISKVASLPHPNGSATLAHMKVANGGVGVRQTNVSELPSAVLTSVFNCVSDTRTRNCLSLVCRDWYYLERQTRSSLMLRGNLCNFLALPHCFRSVTSLDISNCSPWGYSLFQPSADGEAVGQILQKCFPAVTDLTVYVRTALDTRMVVRLWPELESVKLVRWHQRPTDVAALEIGSEIEPVFECPKLRKLDMSKFYCWTEDIFPAVDSGSVIASNLTHLNLLKLSPDGFKSQEIIDISAVCRNLEEFFVICQFNPRFLDPVGDSALESMSANCSHMRVVHLMDTYDWGTPADTLRDDEPAVDDATLTCQGLEILAKNLPLLQDFALLSNQNLWDSRLGVEALCINCPKLTSLQLGHFHGLCTGLEQDGLALGTNLEKLSIKCSVDLRDQNLTSIASGCKKLRKLSLRCCRGISEQGLSDCVRILSQTLSDIEVFGCPQLPCVETLRALEPVRNSMRRLRLDCVWNEDVVKQQLTAVAAMKEDSMIDDCIQRPVASEVSLHGLCCQKGRDLNPGVESRERKAMRLSLHDGGGENLDSSWRKPLSSTCFGRVGDSVRSICGDHTCPYPLLGESSAVKVCDRSEHQVSPDQRCWKNLRDLSICFGVGYLVSPLPTMGLGKCPALTELTIKVEGDCKALFRPAQKEWGLGALSRYPCLTKLNLDLGGVISFSMCPPEGHTDIGLWERHYLSGIAGLGLREMNYYPPWDKELNNRGMSLPGVGHLSQCISLRKLIVHGSAHEHFLSMLHRNTNLRDFQLRWEFYPAPEYETSNEVRVEACRRFEDVLTERRVPD